MKWRLLLSLLPAVALPLTALLLGFSTGPLPRLTGGFGEDTCRSCHTSFGLNEGHRRGGFFNIAGVPSVYSPGAAYPVIVSIAQPGQLRWGFELSARYVTSGRQAGSLIPVDEFTQVKEEAGILYIQHTEEGTRFGVFDGPVEFHFNWIAPDPAEGPVFFNAAGNAADGRDNRFGDYIYTAGSFSSLAGVDFAEVLETRPPALRPEVQRINTASRLVHMPSPVDLAKGDFEVHIEHRFLEPLADSRPGRAFGADAGANILLGLNYALTDRLSAGVSRVRFDQIVSFFGTYEIQTRQESPWKLALHGGVEGTRNFHRQYSPYLQLAGALDYKRLRAHVVPTMIFNTRDDVQMEFLRPFAINPNHNHTVSLGLGVDLAVHPRFSLAVEWVPRLGGFGGLDFTEREKVHNALSGAVKINTWGHVFTITATNSLVFTPARYGVNTQTKDFFLGFNVYRRR